MSNSDRKRRPQDTPDPRKSPRSEVDSAFDLWLQRGLHQLYDGVAAEPIPAELLALIEKDRTRKRT
ncbi:MAG TPA: hypothetical protein VE033_13955 [Acetobacteraceae bacterium]|nr:hypothetical protein [Acetobacteraceae bacterium]